DVAQLVERDRPGVQEERALVEAGAGLRGADLDVPFLEVRVLGQREAAAAEAVPSQAEHGGAGKDRDDAEGAEGHRSSLTEGRRTKARARGGRLPAVVSYALRSIALTPSCLPSPRMPSSCARSSWASRARSSSCSPASVESCARWPRGRGGRVRAINRRSSRSARSGSACTAARGRSCTGWGSAS